MNWRLKLLAKVAAARLRIPYSSWRTLGIFRHGKMDSADYATKIFNLHVKRAFPGGDLNGKTVLEIGPGDSLASAIMATAHGAAGSVLIDAADFASTDIGFYKELSDILVNSGMPDLHISDAKSLEDVLRLCSSRYITTGVPGFADLDDHSVDFVWSHSVLEHIPLEQVSKLISEMYRVVRPGGKISHNIDFQDHLAYGLNNLRFSERFWESDSIKKAGFYTNRIRAKSMHSMFANAGFEISHEGFGRWSKMPLARRKLDERFQQIDDDELLIRTSHFLAIRR